MLRKSVGAPRDDFRPDVTGSVSCGPARFLLRRPRLWAPRGRDGDRATRDGRERNVSLETFLSTNRAELIKRTRAKVASRSSPQTTAIELEQGVPLFLSQLSATLKEIGEVKEGQDARTPLPAKTPSISQSAAAHGLSLLRFGFTIEQVVHDYGEVCQAVT